MYEKIIELDNNYLKDGAQRSFNRTMGFREGSGAFSKYQKEKGHIEKLTFENLKVKAKIILGSNCGMTKENRFEARGASFFAPVFKQVGNQDVKGYMLLALTLKFENDGLVENEFDRIYKEIWEIGYMDSAREYLEAWGKEFFEREYFTETILSPTFGPGLMGMELNQIDSFQEALSLQDIGINITETLTMNPANSVVSLHLFLNNPIGANKSCDRCLGNKVNCQFCKEYIGEENYGFK